MNNFKDEEYNEFATLTGAKSPSEIISRKIIGEFIELVCPSGAVVTTKLKEWNRLFFHIKNYTFTISR